MHRFVVANKLLWSRQIQVWCSNTWDWTPSFTSSCCPSVLQMLFRNSSWKCAAENFEKKKKNIFFLIFIFVDEIDFFSFWWKTKFFLQRNYLYENGQAHTAIIQLLYTSFYTRYMMPCVPCTVYMYTYDVHGRTHHVICDDVIDRCTCAQQLILSRSIIIADVRVVRWVAAFYLVL